MKATIYYPLILAAMVITFLAACNKDASQNTATGKTTTATSTTSASTSIAVAVTAATDSTVKDTVFMVNCFPPNSKKDSVAFSSLPSAIATYLTTNYAGYTYKMSFKIDSAKTTTAYIVVIQYNGAPVGLKFTAAGVFVKVLEQQDGPQMRGQPGRPGAPFGDRANSKKDTIALTDIPLDVLEYFEQNYPTDTLLHASVTHDSTYILISKNKGMYATDISKAGKLISRIQIIPPAPAPKPITADKLPSAISTYLSTTYPGYVFNAAFLLGKDGEQGYAVLITENNTKYSLRFDSSGKFVKAITLH